MTEDELAAVIAALQTVMQQSDERPQPQPSAWKHAARLEALGVQ